ncbi:hypothetical protein PFISCL1PPCAC_19864 [Pristionchus fissidentatus]|uniref:LolA-like domain-containing protein n=1 Tax=Pristionchus fissidentatus TaxID=1538716 RepID=A0AAV5W9R4_9BILA|nr:hypothetical protein PFISCL1PPCAC_19864 [Pristionchus fissidentatus]
MLKIAYGILLFFGTIGKCSIGPFPNLCAREDKAGSATVPKDVKLPSSYKVSAVFTDWHAKSTMEIEETRMDETFAIETSTREHKLRWSTIQNNIVLRNKTECSVVKETLLFSLSSDITEIIPLNTSSISAFVSSIIDRNISGSNNYVRVVSGVEGVGWLGCVNVTESSAVVAVEVVYAGTDSFSPPSPGFKNPLVLSITISRFNNSSDVNSTMTSRISLDFAPFQEATELPTKLKVPHGIICNGLPVVEIPVEFPDDFVVLYTKKDQDGSVTGKLSYDSRHNISGESIFNGRAYFFNQSFSKDSYLVVHDASHGAEYIFSSTPSCVAHALPTAVGDMTSDQMTPAIQLLIPQFHSLNFSLYSNISAIGMSVLEYRAFSDGKVVEVVLDNLKATSIVTHFRGAIESSIVITIFPQDSISLISRLNGCYKHTSNELVSFVLSGVSMDKLYSWREEVVSDHMAIALAAIYNASISPYRLSFFFTSHDNIENTRVVLKVADGWEGATEMNASQFIVALNATLLGGITFTLSDKEVWKTMEAPLTPYPPPFPISPPSFIGYTGGSMFVLGIFMLIFGVAVGAGGVYAVLRRQRISTLAYQVFE